MPSHPKSQVDNLSSPIAARNESGYIATFEGLHQCSPSQNGHIQMPRETSLDIFLSNLDLGTFECQTNNYHIGPENTMQAGHSPLSHDRAALEQVAADIRKRLESSAATMNLPNVPSKDILESIQAITGRQIAIWIRLYFRHFHKHGPVIHEATFNPTTAALPLVLAIMSVGAMVSALKFSKESNQPFR